MYCTEDAIYPNVVGGAVGADVLVTLTHRPYMASGHKKVAPRLS